MHQPVEQLVDLIGLNLRPGSRWALARIAGYTSIDLEIMLMGFRVEDYSKLGQRYRFVVLFDIELDLTLA